MKRLIVVAVFFTVAATLRADIQDPPGNDYGPTRKLGRGISNLLFAPAEITTTIGKVNREEGNAAAAGYGVVKGLGRSMQRHMAGLWELLSWPFPLYQESYHPVLPLDIPFIHEGYSEFPPELGNESKYDYVRDY
jgi:putative exosortase-associated protein (TIGR04073 family)